MRGGPFFNTRSAAQLVKNYLSLEEFNYERVNNASKACGPLCSWVVSQVGIQCRVCVDKSYACVCVCSGYIECLCVIWLR